MFSSSQPPHRLWGPPTFLWSGYREDKVAGALSWSSPPSSAKINNSWSYTSPHPHVFMAWCYIKHWDNLPFVFCWLYYLTACSKTWRHLVWRNFYQNIRRHIPEESICRVTAVRTSHLTFFSVPFPPRPNILSAVLSPKRCQHTGNIVSTHPYVARFRQYNSSSCDKLLSDIVQYTVQSEHDFLPQLVTGNTPINSGHQRALFSV